MSQDHDLRTRWDCVNKDINDAARAAGRSRSDIRLLAVSKGQPAEAIAELYTLGQRQFGENYVQEMVAKAGALQDLSGLELVFIGQIQSNKLKHIAQVASVVQSVGSVRHAQLLDRHVREMRPGKLPIYLLVNAGDEATKHGFQLSDVTSAYQDIVNTCTSLTVKGIMSIPPILPETEAAQLYETLQKVARTVGEGELSLGMSQDLAIAIAHGSNCVRIGTALFGPRKAK